MTGQSSPERPRWGRFQLHRRIGIGGMGEIFLAEDTANGGYVAIKRLLPEAADDPVFVGMFLDEARLATQIRHPNVAQVVEYGREGTSFFLVMELVEGVSLKELLHARAGRGIPWPVAARIMAEAALALDYAHRLTDIGGAPMGIVHRDVSPGNLMLSHEGAVKLVDFGLAKARTQLVKTRPGLVKGKFGYLAPEQLSGRVDWRTDIFGLGLCLFESVAGRPLFDKQTAAATLHAIDTFAGPPALAGRVDGVPDRLDDILARSLHPDPEARYPSAAAMRAALADAVVTEGLAPDATAEALARQIRTALQEAGPTTAPASALPVFLEETTPDLDVAPPRRGAWWLVFAALTAAAVLGGWLLLTLR
ncbi:MAG: serine/threonine-protein kinase [Sandaracinaceae bacterium]